MPKVYQGLVHRALVFHPFKKRGVEKTRINIACRRITQVASVGGLEYNEGVYLLGYTLVPSSLQFSLELVHVRASSTSATAYGVITKLEDDDDVDVFHCRPGYGANVEPSRFRPGSSRLIPLSSCVRSRGSSERTLGAGWRRLCG